MALSTITTSLGILGVPFFERRHSCLRPLNFRGVGSCETARPYVYGQNGIVSGSYERFLIVLSTRLARAAPKLCARAHQHLDLTKYSAGPKEGTAMCDGIVITQ